MSSLSLGSADPLPDFVIVGTMKSGTTSLHGWLGRHPKVYLPRAKEPDFFSKERAWRRGFEWYASLFAGARVDQIRGEASVSYSFPHLSEVAAERLNSLSPSVKVICLVRHPVERARSHYRHEVLRGREDRTFAEAMQDPGSDYLSRSMYWTCLKPYVDRLPRDQILVVRSEDLFSSNCATWFEILAFLGVHRTERPQERLNAAEQRAQFTRPMRALWRAGVRRAPSHTPAPIRRLARLWLLRNEPSPLLRTSEDPLDGPRTRVLWEDCLQLTTWMGKSGRLWEPDLISSAQSSEQDGLPVWAPNKLGNPSGQ
jgi:hypothetical protein